MIQYVKMIRVLAAHAVAHQPGFQTAVADWLVVDVSARHALHPECNEDGVGI
jgi:hypothetical protein